MDPGGEKSGYGGEAPPPYGQQQPPPPGGQTVVIMSSPQQVNPGAPGARDWVNGLFGCFNNCNVCILSWFCPCYVVGQNAEALGESFMVYTIASLFIPVFVQCFVRAKIRGRLQIVGSEISDFFQICCCQPCALAQERNEVLIAIEKGEIAPNMGVPQVIYRQ